DYNRHAALSLAASEGHIVVLLFLAADTGNEDAFVLALRRGAVEVNENDDNVGLTPLMHAATKCYSEIMRTHMECYDEDVDV
ncbi:hypothetical protein V491_08747, partial [Pseudogymnoascus sp. VKM F-3775]